MTSPRSSHWLKDVAGHAGLVLELPVRPDIVTLRRVWGRVVEACGTTEEEFTRRVAGHFRIGVADVTQRDPQAVALIPEPVARRYGILGLSLTDRNLIVATSDPSNRSAWRAIVEHSGREPIFLMASPGALAQAVEEAYRPRRAPRNTLERLISDVAKSDFQVVTSDGRGHFTAFELEDPAVAKLAEVVLHQAVRHRATEVHVEPGRDQGRIRYRIDGVLQHVVLLPPAAQQRLVARLRHQASGADPDEGFLVRVSAELERAAHLISTPTPDGELVSIRLGVPGDVPGLDKLGLEPGDLATIRSALRRTDGLVLVTGPARSGMTTFLYACLHELSRRSVLSLESRIEHHVPGVTQIRYDAATGRSFAETLQQLLDRAPDVVHAGEIRDLPTARIALRTALTGRKVLATVHAPDAVSGVRRLLDLGLAPGRLAESLHAVISLRLVRRLCPTCAREVSAPDQLPARERKLADMLRIVPARRAVGCPACAGTGFLGQLPVVETLVLNRSLQQLVQEGVDDLDLQLAARMEGLRPLAEGALQRVASGHTTVEEVERVLGVVPTRRESPRTAGPVLLVDDDPQDRLLVGSIVRDMGFEVVEAEGGGAALERLRKTPGAFSLVVLDLMMPGMDGLEVLDSMRQSLETQFLPVLVLTSSPDPRKEIELLDRGADDYVLKPVAVDRLQARIRAVLRRSGVRIDGVPAGEEAAPVESAPPSGLAAGAEAAPGPDA